MWFMNKKTLAILVLFTITGYSFAYNFEITNKTKEPLVVRVKPRLGKHQFGIIDPGKEKLFAFTGMSALLCLESIHVDKYDPTEKDMESYALQSVPIQMVDSMKGFLEKGSDEKADKALTVDKKEAEKTGTEKIEQAAAKLAEISLCHDRKFVLIDTGKEAMIDLGGSKVSAGYNEIIALTEKSKVVKEQ